MPGAIEKQEPITGRDIPPALDEKTLRRLYSYMLKCRLVEERIRVLFRQGRFAGNYFGAVGQEATEVGATLDLLPEDTIAPSPPQFRYAHHEGDAAAVDVRPYLWQEDQS
jgi:TPP-dependent pyruvate/acetoin dehydrogenase alpha subunit